MPEVIHHKICEHPLFKRKERGQGPVVAPDYVELCVTTNFSFLRGASHPEEFVEQAKQLGYSAIAITDLHSVSGIVRAHIAAKDVGIPLIVGARVTLYRDIPPAPLDEEIPPEALRSIQEPYLSPLSLCLYPMDRAAYGRLCQLLTEGKLRAPKGECYLTVGDILSFQEGLIGIAQVINWEDPSLTPLLQELQSHFTDDRLSLALWNTYGPNQQRRNTQTVQLATELRIPLVVTNDCYYHIPERRALQDVVTCIRLGCTLQNAGFSLFANSERALKSPQEMHRLFSRYPDALRRTREIAERVHFSLDEVKYEYPHEICPANKTPRDQLAELTNQGARDRYPKGVPLPVQTQISQELSLIADLQYEKYFLTVHDIVRFAREKNILCQGRGAAANSAVCYMLGITSVDPDRINLLFERFISKERNEPPDIDIDFEHERREEVLQYVYNKYGRHRAALVAEVITYRTRSSLRDVGKVFGLSLDTIDSLIKLVTRSEPGLLSDDALRAAGLPAEEVILHTCELATTLIGFPRHLSQHVGGMIVSEAPLSTIVPIERAAMPDRTIVEWDKDDIEAMGMLKIDLLALGMLTCIRKGFGLINARLPDAQRLSDDILKLHTIPPEDSTVYDMLCAADTIGVFQIESRAQMSMLPRLKPRCFYDLVIEVAIVRPGPIQGGMVHPYLRRRSGKEHVTYPDERIKKILGHTLGVPIFQEQAMELAIVAAGFTPGEADKLRRAMASWKRNKSLRHFETKIVEGMLRKGYSREFAESCFRQIRGFGEYGFPQSHAASFALLVYVSAWLKKHHPAAFAAALMNSQPMGFYQPAQLIQDAVRHGVHVRPIDANLSDWDCTLEDNAPALRLGMRLIKNLQEKEVDLLLAARKQHGRFSSLTRLWRESRVKVSTLRALARADAFRSLGLTRQEALWELRRLRDEPLPLLETIKEQREVTHLPSPSPQGEVLRDYSVTGLSLKAHPLRFLRPQLDEDGVLTARSLTDERFAPKGRRIQVAGIVLVRQRPSTARGIVFMTIEDETGITNLIIRPEIFQRFRAVLCDSVILCVRGKVQREEKILHILVEEAATLDPHLSEMPAISRDFH